jgi:phosphinothricin acetyltransferase
MTAGDAGAVLRIYAEGIETRLATFETEAPSWEDWDEGHVDAPRLMAEGPDGAALGWAALSPVSSRCVYAGVAESSVYIAAAARGRGVGRALMEALIERSEAIGIWTLQAGCFPENDASIGLHQAVGFRIVGMRERVGQLDGVWRDVVLLERRSDRVGVD